ncbi:hypothetical protein [Actinocrispum sp. NPDC049592]|uniref:hypothetical protein n=1 Tax=Actinocrispum sp. NPDC049592 TaxID=3154835 RepID=UPI00341652EA
MRARPKSKKNSEAEPQSLSFMQPIEPRDPADEPEKPSRAERRAAKQQHQQGHGAKVQTMRNQATQNHRNFANRRSG